MKKEEKHAELNVELAPLAFQLLDGGERKTFRWRALRVTLCFPLLFLPERLTIWTE